MSLRIEPRKRYQINLLQNNLIDHLRKMKCYDEERDLIEGFIHLLCRVQFPGDLYLICRIFIVSKLNKEKSNWGELEMKYGMCFVFDGLHFGKTWLLDREDERIKKLLGYEPTLPLYDGLETLPYMSQKAYEVFLPKMCEEEEPVWNRDHCGGCHDLEDEN